MRRSVTVPIAIDRDYIARNGGRCLPEERSGSQAASSAALGIQRGGFRGSRKQWLGGAALLRGSPAPAARAAATAAASVPATITSLPGADVFRSRVSLGRQGGRARAAAVPRRSRIRSLRDHGGRGGRRGRGGRAQRAHEV